MVRHGGFIQLADKLVYAKGLALVPEMAQPSYAAFQPWLCTVLRKVIAAGIRQHHLTGADWRLSRLHPSSCPQERLKLLADPL